MSSVSIQNKNGVSVLIDEADLGLLRQHKNGHWHFIVEANGYISVWTKKKFFLHRLIMNPSTEMLVDHIDGNKLDNRRRNLRICTRTRRNMKSAGCEGSSFKGVWMNGKKWAARISIDNKQVHLGTFATEVEAALAYDAAARLQDTEFRFLNFPEEVASA